MEREESIKVNWTILRPDNSRNNDTNYSIRAAQKVKIRPGHQSLKPMKIGNYFTNISNDVHNSVLQLHLCSFFYWNLL
jgi:hypothetical protein